MSRKMKTENGTAQPSTKRSELKFTGLAKWFETHQPKGK